MSLKDDILDGVRDRVEKQPNPWQPYRGEAGGQGWVNAITGEVRYQQDRPAPGEGTPEDAEPQAVGDLDEEIPEHVDEFDPIEPDLDDYADAIDGMDSVTFEIGGEERPGNPISVDEETGTIEIVDDETFETYHVEPDQIEENPVEAEPPQGWADGWTDAPEDWGDLDEGQTIEVYDLEAGEYHEATVEYVGENGDAMDITLEGADAPTTIGDVDFGDADEMLVTAAEEAEADPTMEMFDPEDFEAGDEILAYNPYSEETTIVRIDSVGDGGFAGISEEEGSMTFSADLQDEWQIVDPEHADEVIDSLPEDLEPDYLDELEMFEGELAIVEHPTEGRLVGEIEIIDHDEDGRHLYIGGSEVGIPLSDPDHPLHQEFIVEEIDSPYEGYDPATDSQWLTEGDELVLQNPETGDRSPYAVVEATNDDVHISGLGWMPREDLEDGEINGLTIDSADVEPQPLVPEDAEEWREMTDGAFHDTNVGDTIWWKNPQTGLPETAEVTGRDGGFLEVDHPDVDDVNADQIQDVAETAPKLPETNLDLDDIYESQEIEVAYRDADGEIHHVEGMATRVDGYSGDLDIVTPDGGVHSFTPDMDYVVADDNIDAGFGGSAWEDTEPDQIASEIEEAAGMDHQRWKLDRNEKASLRAQFYTRFPKDTVDKFYELQSGGHGSWKSNSGSSDAETYEVAFKEALGIDAPHREKGGRMPPRELRAMAETAAILSQRHFEAQYGSGTPLYRGTSPKGAQKLVANYFADPAAEEYESPFLAMNNFSSSRHTAERFEGEGTTPGATVEWQTEAEDVVAMHDYLFTQEGNHEQEDEITLRGDMDSIPAGFIQLKANDEGPRFDLTPDQWTGEEAQTFASYLHEEGESVASTVEWDEDLIHNALEIERDLREAHDVDTEYNDFFEEARVQADEAGVDHDYILDPDSIHLEGIEDVGDFREEMEIQFEAPNGEDYEGIVLGVDEETGEVTVEDDFHGEVHYIEPQDIEQVSYSPEPYGPGADALDAEEWQPDDFESGDKVYVSPYGQGNRTDDGIVMDVDEDGTVEVSIDGKSDYFDLNDPSENDRIAPFDAADGSEGSGGGETDTQPVNDSGDLDPGDTVVYETSHDDEPTEHTVEEIKDSGTVVLDNGMHVVSHAVPDMELVSEGSDTDGPSLETDAGEVYEGATVEIEDPESEGTVELPVANVEPGQDKWEVHYTDVPWIDNDDPAYADEDGIFDEYIAGGPDDVLDVDDGESEGSDAPAVSTGQYADFGDGEYTEILDVSNDAVLVESPDTGNEIVLDRQDIVDVQSEGPDDGGDSVPEWGDPITPTDYSVGEVVEFESPYSDDDQSNTYSVIDVAQNEESPVELEHDASGNRFLYWPDGNIEDL